MKIRGLYMHTSWLYTDVKGQVLEFYVELQAVYLI